MGTLVDSSIFIGWERGRRGIEGDLEVGSDRGIAAITLSELLVGVHRAESGDRRQRRKTFIDGVAAVFPVLPFGVHEAEVHAKLAAELGRAGSPVGHHDLLIAATALARDWLLLTRDRRSFPRIPGLRVRLVE